MLAAEDKLISWMEALQQLLRGLGLGLLAAADVRPEAAQVELDGVERYGTLAAPASEIWNQDRVAKVKLRLVEDDPPAWTTLPRVERSIEPPPQLGCDTRVRSGWPG